jgi:hypothetical protein
MSPPPPFSDQWEGYGLLYSPIVSMKNAFVIQTAIGSLSIGAILVRANKKPCFAHFGFPALVYSIEWGPKRYS